MTKETIDNLIKSSTAIRIRKNNLLSLTGHRFRRRRTRLKIIFSTITRR